MLYTLLIFVSIFITVSPTKTISPFKMWYNVNNVIDSATHIFSDGKEPYTYVTPVVPDSLSKCNANCLIEKMNENGVTKSIITQPINHKFDHSYLDSILSSSLSSRLHGIFLFNPQLTIDEGKAMINEFKMKKYVGMRLNPALFAENDSISDSKGKEFYKYCGMMDIPINIMCFDGGIKRYYNDIINLIKFSPDTKLVIDHCGFFLQSNEVDNDSWDQLLSLAQVSPNVYVKVSALFRLSKESVPFLDLDERLISLVECYGSNRLIFGSDFPYTEVNGGYHDVVNSFIAWPKCRIKLTQADWEAIFGKTAKDLYNI